MITRFVVLSVALLTLTFAQPGAAVSLSSLELPGGSLTSGYLQFSGFSGFSYDFANNSVDIIPVGDGSAAHPFGIDIAFTKFSTVSLTDFNLEYSIHVTDNHQITGVHNFIDLAGDGFAFGNEMVL